MQSQSPQKITSQDSGAPMNVASVDAEAVEQELVEQYQAYRRKNIPEPFKNLKRMINKFLGNAMIFLHQFWREIVPEVIRGQMQELTIPSQKPSQLQSELFSQHSKKRNPFFLISFRSDCSEEQVQQAYMNATNIVSQGFSLKYEELYHGSSFRDWKVEKGGPLEKYCIYFMKYDLFGQMVWFGRISKEVIESKEDSAFLEDFKREVRSAIRAYEEVQRSFLGSYIEKEDRFALDPQSSEL